MEREYYHSIDSLKLIAVVCFCIFAFGYFEYFGSVIKYTLTFALPLLYMIFGFLLLGENEERTDIILRSLFRNLAVLGIAFIFLGIASFIYMKITGITIVITLDSFINQFVFGKWQLPVGSFVWFTEELVVSIFIFWILSKTNILSKKWFQFSLLGVTLLINLVFGEFSSTLSLGTLPNFFLNHAIPFMLIGKMIRDHEEQIFDLGPLTAAVTFVIGLIITGSELLIFKTFNVFSFTSNYIGSIVCAIALMMIAIQLRSLGEESGFAYWSGKSATWMFLVSQPIGVIVTSTITSTDKVVNYLKGFVIIIASFFFGLLMAVIFHFISPKEPVAQEDEESDELYYE